MLKERPDRLLRLLLGWTALTLLFVWLPLIRGLMDGASYAWGARYWGVAVGGAGMGGQYWLLLIQGFVGVWMLALGWRGARPPFHALMLLWHGVLATSSIYSAITHPDQYRFRGDTMGIDVSLAWVGPVLFGGFFLAAVRWTMRDLRRSGRRPVPRWTRANRIWAVLLALLLPLQFMLLRFGPPHGLSDQVGVVLTILQCLFLGWVFKPPRYRAGLLRASG